MQIVAEKEKLVEIIFDETPVPPQEGDCSEDSDSSDDEASQMEEKEKNPDS